MASKPNNRKTESSEPAPKKAASKAAAKKTTAPSGGEVLDLLAPKKKRVRAKATIEESPQAAAVEVDDGKKDLATQKAEALNLFEEAEQKEKKRRTPKSQTESAQQTGSMLPPISRLQEAKAKRQEALEQATRPQAVTPPPLAPIAVPMPLEATPPTAGDDPEGETVDEAKIINIKPPIIVKDLAERMGLKTHKIIAELMKFDVFVSATHAIEPDVAAKLCEAHGFVFEKEKREKGAGVHKVEEKVEEPPPPEPEPEDKLFLRPPIITFMGHVDHGKTSLLDAIRKTKVAAGEAGGITQHIGAYSVSVGNQKITFLDTPGHAAFTEMRARGANVTDIVVLVVASDDGFMPQTIEAMNHAKAANVTLMVAINKCDLAGANPTRVKQQLQGYDLAPEEWGGQTVCVEVSATKGTGIDTLLEMMALQAEVLELKANPDAPARGVVIESSLQPGKGPVATAIIQGGTLKVGAAFICGPYSGKVKSLLNDQGENIKEAGPGMPVEILGFSGQPNVGDEVVQMDSERSAKKLSEERLEEQRREKLNQPKKATLENFFSNFQDGEKKNMRVVLKTDVQGSLEAITKSLQQIQSDKIDLSILHGAAGAISESDILLASASNAVVIGFNVKVESNAVKVAKRENVQVKLYSIIYELLDQVKDAMLGLLDPLVREKVIGHARVKQVFKLTKGIIGGSVVIDGRLLRNARARVLRGDQPVYDGGFATLRRFKEDVAEVRNGLECGIRLGDFNEYQEGDIIECYELEKVAQSL